MKYYVLDASVCLKMVLPDEMNDETTTKIYEIFDGDDLVEAPSLLTFEFLNTIGRRFCNTKKSVKVFNLIKDLGLKIRDLNDNEIIRTIDLVNKYAKVSFYDASYHAMALENNGVFFTADKKYFDKVKKEGCIELL